jgi:hypothetical protein
VARELGLKVDLWIVLLGGRKIESNVGLSIRCGPDARLTDGVLTEDDDRSNKVPVPLVTFPLSRLTSVLYVLE